MNLCVYTCFVYLQPFCVTLDFKLFIDLNHILFLFYLLLWFWDFTINNLHDFIKIYTALIKDIFLRQIGATHWQQWLQADGQRDAVQGLGPTPATRALDASAPGRALAPHTDPLADLPFDPAPEGAIPKSVPLPPARGATEPTKCPLCADKYYTSGAMLGHLAWLAVHGAPPVEDKEAAYHILQGRAEMIPAARPVRPVPPPPASGRPPGGPRGGRGGIRSGPGSQRCSASRVCPRGTGPPGPPVGPPGSRLPTPHGPGTPWRPGCSSGPHGDANTGQQTPGGHGGRRPLAPLLEPAQQLRPARPVLPETLRRRRGPAACTDKEHLITGMLRKEGGFAIML